MGFNAPSIAAKPVSRQSAGQAAFPHLDLTSDDIRGYIHEGNRIATRSSTLDIHQHDTLPATAARLDLGSAVDDQSVPPDIQPVALNLHPNIEGAESAPAGAPIQVAEGTPTLSVIAQLGQLIDPELGQLANAALQEQQLVGGIG